MLAAKFPDIAALVGTDTLDRDRALCSVIDVDPEVWFPHPTDSDTRARAQSICAMCPIKTECAAFGTDNKLDGVWGGVFLHRGKIIADSG